MTISIEYCQNMKNRKLVIVAGAAGEIGTAYIKKIIQKEIDCIGIVRNRKLENVLSSHFQTIVCDLTNQKEVQDKFETIQFGDYEQIIYLHTIGTDKFDPRGYPDIHPMNTIDPEVYDTNVNSFKYLFRYCTERIKQMNNSEKKIDFKTVIIAGVPDKYTPFVIEGFCEAKFILRQYIQSGTQLYPKWFSGLSVNITSTITRAALAVRPKAETKFWLTPQEVVDRSTEEILSKSIGYREIDIIKESPEFFEKYYTDNVALYKKWSKETGIY